MPNKHPAQWHQTVSVPRRRFVLGAVSAGVCLACGGAKLSWAAVPSTPQTLRGNRFELSIGYQEVNFTGNPRMATVVNGSIPGPVLRWKEGEHVTLRVTNHLAHDSSIHWHGIILPTEMDGVPGLSFDGIKPGETFEYSFDVNQNGTYWYHSHSDHQEQTGHYGALVIEPKEPEPFSYDRDYVILLSDWTDEDPHRLFAKLKKLSHYYNFRERTVSDVWREIREKGVAQTWSDRAMWNRMRMSDSDISDVTGYTYTFLMNGQTPADGWLGLFKRGEKIRLRIINGSAMTFFDVRIPGLKMTVVAADGQNIQPVSVDEFRIGVAETYDVIVTPEADTAYTVFAQAIDRSGFARGTLTPDPMLKGIIPEMDPAPVLSHSDMGMAHGGEHGGHAMPMDQGSQPNEPPAMDHSMHQGMDHSTMDHSTMNQSTMGDSSVDHGSAGHSSMDHGAMNHNGNRTPAQEQNMPMDHTAHMQSVMGSGKAGYGSAAAIHHAPAEFGPQVDMRAESPQYRLNDPGVGLRDNGRKVLTYADLRNFYETPDPREPNREIELHLTGNMSRYMWSINGVSYADAEPIHLTYGERVRITLVNDTMMNHPIHLHGMWSDLETGDGRHIPRKHTVIVQPGAKISYLVTADAVGRWAYHCHLLYHMGGMFREVRVG